jgi:hypothetical protein
VASSQMRSLPHRLGRGAWRLEAKATTWILLVLTLLGLLGWLCLTQASQVSTARYRLWEKETEKARLQRQNAELLAEVAEMLSVARLETRARDSDYIPAEGHRYLYVLDYSANSASRGGLAAVARPIEGTVIPLEEHEDKSVGVTRWWEQVISQFAAWTGAQP